MEEYYYNRLNKHQKIAYTEMKKGLSEINSSFYVTRLERNELSMVYELLMMDHPELFYCVEGNYRYFPDSSYIEMKPEYLFKKDKILEHRKAINTRIERICNSCKETDQLKKALYLHDFLCQNVRYDKLKKTYSHQVIGPLTQGVGVCEGIAKSFKALCDKMGIYCICIVCNNNPEKGIKYRHMWNMVKLNNKYYHIDATFDGSLSKRQLRHDYFLIDDKSVFKDHEALIYKAFDCNDIALSFYRTNKQTYTDVSQLPQIVKKLTRKANGFVVEYIGGGLNRDILKETINQIEQVLITKNKKGSYAVNFPLGVIDCILSETESAIIEQQPSESEEN